MNMSGSSLPFRLERQWHCSTASRLEDRLACAVVGAKNYQVYSQFLLFSQSRSDKIVEVVEDSDSGFQAAKDL